MAVDDNVGTVLNLALEHLDIVGETDSYYNCLVGIAGQLSRGVTPKAILVKMEAAWN